MFKVFKEINKPIRNKTTDNILSTSYILCDSLLSKFFGLMFKIHPPNVPYVFIFSKKTKQEFHTFFMFFPINIYFLDENKKVIEHYFLRPWKIIAPNKEYQYVIESYRKLDVSIGDILDF